MNETSEICGTRPESSTPSPELAAGHMPSNSPGGPQTDPSGPEAVPASRSARTDSEGEKTTQDTCGPSGTGSFGTSALQQYLESRLRVLLENTGCPAYRLIWKHWTTPSGQRVCVRQASVRRIYGSGCTGWPTPTASYPANSATICALGRQKSLLLGRAVAKFEGETEPSDFLSPTFVAWLMGYPDRHLRCVPLEMRWSRKSPLPLSVQRAAERVRKMKGKS